MAGLGGPSTLNPPLRIMWRLTTGAYESVELIRYVDHMWSHQFTWRVYQLFYGNALNCGDSRVSAFVVQAHSSIYSAFLVDWTESEYRQPTVRRSISTSVETGSELLYNLLSPVYQTQKDAAVQLIGYIQKPVLIEPNSKQFSRLQHYMRYLRRFDAQHQTVLSAVISSQKTGI